MYKMLILTALVLLSSGLSAHEGHDQIPGAIKANHGGVVKAGHEINLEYVVAGDEVKLYPVSHDGKDLSSNEVKLTVKSKLPKGKLEILNLDSKEGVFVVKVDFKKAYRLEMNVEADHQGKKSTFKFQIEK